jgi:Na+/melibiose symporter-like transporter
LLTYTLNGNDNLVEVLDEHKGCTIRPAPIKAYVFWVAFALIVDGVLTTLAYENVWNMHKLFPKYPNIAWQQTIILLATVLIALLILTMHNRLKSEKVDYNDRSKLKAALTSQLNQLPKPVKYTAYAIVLITFFIGAFVARESRLFYSLSTADGLGIMSTAVVIAVIFFLIHHNYPYQKAYENCSLKQINKRTC